MESYESLQQLIFILELRLKQQEDVIMNMEHHLALKRMKQIEEYDKKMEKREKEKEAEMKAKIASAKSRSSGGYRFRSR